MAEHPRPDEVTEEERAEQPPQDAGTRLREAARKYSDASRRRHAEAWRKHTEAMAREGARRARPLGAAVRERMHQFEERMRQSTGPPPPPGLPRPPVIDMRVRVSYDQVWGPILLFLKAYWRYILGVPFRSETYRKFAYHFVGLPIGICYFVFLLVGLIIGVSTVPIIIGFPILFIILKFAFRFGAFERRMAKNLLGVTIPPPIQPGLGQRSRWRRFMAQLRDQVTWTNILYLVLKLPFACLSVFVVGFFVGRTLNFLVSGQIWFWNPRSPDLGGFILRLFEAGIFFYLTLHVSNGVAYLAGRYARAMLGPNEAALRLVETEQIAEQERVKAERADQSRKELIVNVSHELRTPTASIRGHVESLLIAMDKEKGAGPGVDTQQLQSYLNIIHRETERLSTLVDDLLTLARSESDELRLNLQRVNPAEVVAEVHETLAPLAWRQRSVTLVKDVQPDLPLTWADRQRLLQVVLNLVRNAITHTPAGGIVSIGLGMAGPHHVALVVADTGSGIPPEEIDYIFDRFYRVDASRTRTSGGFGLGLAIVKELVTAMGGTVSVASKVGEGSAFRVLLRVVDSEVGAPAQPVETREPARIE